MKKITLSIFLALGSIFSFTAQSQCVADGTMIPTSNPGEFTITDLSTTTGSNPYSYFVSGEPGGNYVYLQPNTTTGTYQYSQNGSYSYGFIIVDSLAGCSDQYWDSITVTGIGTTPSCQADFTILQDSLNPGIYWCWNNSTGGSPAVGLTYLWDFGDGTTSTQAYPTHTFSSLGVYTICLTVSEPNSTCTSVHCDTIVVSVKASGTTLNVLPPGATASIKEEKSFTGLISFPNPVDNELTLEMNSNSIEDLTISLTSLTGQIISSNTFSTQLGSNNLKIKTSDLNAGVYIIRVSNRNDDNSQTIRFIKK